MALLYSKEEEMDCESNGDFVRKRKMQGKKRRIDSASGPQQPKVSLVLTFYYDQRKLNEIVFYREQKAIKLLNLLKIRNHE